MSKSTAKLLLFLIVVAVVYLAFFNFNAQQAYTYTVGQLKAIF